MNKKGFSMVIRGVIVISVILIFYMFGLIFIKEGGDQFIIQPLENISLQIAEATSVRNETVTTLNLLNTRYNQVANLPYDLLFFAFWMIALGTTFIFSYKSRKLPVGSFFGVLFIGSLVMLLIIGFVAQFTDWFILNFYDLLFSDLNIETPIMDYFFANLNWITYLWIMVCLFINRLDVTKEVSDVEVQP